jgi:hypothetical protein
LQYVSEWTTLVHFEGGPLASELLHLHLTEVVWSDPNEPSQAGFPCWGWQEGWADDVIFALNRWNWHISTERVKAAGFAVFEAAGKIVAVAEIDNAIDGPQPGMHSLVGRAIDSGPMYERWIGRPSPVLRINRGGVNWIPDSAG